MTFLFANNISTTLALPVRPGDTQLVVGSGTGSRLPTPVGNQKVHLTLADVDGNFEIVRLISRVGDTLTVERGVEGTVPRNWAAGSRVELRLTAAMLDNFLQKTGGTMSGDLNMAGHRLIAPDLSSENLQVASLRTATILPADGNTAGAMQLRSNGRLPTINGSPVLTAALFSRVIFMFAGPETDIPPHFQLCDGTNGTPDLRDKFIVAAGPTRPAGTTGGSDIVTTSAAGGHDHGGSTAPHALTIDEMPLHGHPFFLSTRRAGQADGVGGFLLKDADTAVYQAYTGTPTGTLGEQIGGTGGNQPHRHGITAEPDHTHTVRVEPVYYALAFIMLKPGVL